MFLFPDKLILLKGAGDLGTGVAWRLHKAGFPVLITELAQPLVVRRTVAFASAVYEGQVTVEGVTARRAKSFQQARAWLGDGVISVLVDPETRAREEFAPSVLIDAVMAKRNTGTRLTDAPLVIALGPGFTPNVDCHAVVETNRGHYLGRVWWDRPAEPNTDTPGEIGGKRGERVLRAPQAGQVTSVRTIGDAVTQGETIAFVDGARVVAPFDGILRGLVHNGLSVKAGAKIGDVDARANREACLTISDKALAVGGGVLEAVLAWMNRRVNQEA
ncbi:MAG: EF2563 family selenium-dependent molybdenum hydroxylase system protein [Chloroflexi bacterium]|nr:EF2563 family selenium-dependent molybdenum hydroxylase system protein [Chloroflexota bacterium]